MSSLQVLNRVDALVLMLAALQRLQQAEEERRGDDDNATAAAGLSTPEVATTTRMPRDAHGRTPLHWCAMAATRPWATAASLGATRAALIAAGADAAARDRRGATAAHVAARLGAGAFAASLAQQGGGGGLGAEQGEDDDTARPMLFELTDNDGQ